MAAAHVGWNTDYVDASDAEVFQICHASTVLYHSCVSLSPLHVFNMNSFAPSKFHVEFFLRFVRLPLCMVSSAGSS